MSDLLEHWPLIEADFAERYRITWPEDWARLTTRKFFVLLNGLGASSNWHRYIRSTYEPSTAGGPDLNLIEDPEEADEALARAFAGFF